MREQPEPPTLYWNSLSPYAAGGGAVNPLPLLLPYSELKPTSAPPCYGCAGEPPPLLSYEQHKLSPSCSHLPPWLVLLHKQPIFLPCCLGSELTKLPLAICCPVPKDCSCHHSKSTSMGNNSWEEACRLSINSMQVGQSWCLFNIQKGGRPI